MTTNFELPFDVPTSPELDAYLQQIDEALDACFMGELEDAMTRAAEARDAAGAAPLEL